MRPPADNQRGLALLATMMAVALMTVLVVDFTYSTSASFRSSANQINALRANYLARSGVNVGLGLLAQDARNDALSQQPYDGLDELWAKPFPPLPVGGGTASLSIVDETRKLNINQLVNATNGVVNVAFAQTLELLLQAIGVSPDILPAIIDWLDQDSIESQGGAEADYYMRLIPPYEPRNGPMPTIADLRMIRGVDDPTFMRLREFLTAAPESKVNVNTAPPEVLMALIPELANQPSALQTVLEQRPFKTSSDLKAALGSLSEHANLANLFTTQSDYFTIAGVGSYSGARSFVYATVRRNGVGPALLSSWHED
jgi:general secretion pathway protein K